MLSPTDLAVRRLVSSATALRGPVETLISTPPWNDTSGIHPTTNEPSVNEEFSTGSPAGLTIRVVVPGRRTISDLGRLRGWSPPARIVDRPRQRRWVRSATISMCTID